MITKTNTRTSKAFTHTLEASSVNSPSERGFTTVSERQNRSELLFFLSAAGAKLSTAKKEDGFTLIELLVVIAIIGILSAIVLAALGGARSSAKETSILSALNSARTQAELYNLSVGSYSGLCDDEKIQEIVTSLESTGDGAACWEADITYPTGYQSELTMIDYGIAATYDGTYYAASPLGSGTFDSEAIVVNGDPTINWYAAKTACSDAGNRLPSPSVLRAVYSIGGNAPLEEAGFAASYTWSALESPSMTTLAYGPSLDHGAMYRSTKTAERHVRCLY